MSWYVSFEIAGEPLKRNYTIPLPEETDGLMPPIEPHSWVWAVKKAIELKQAGFKIKSIFIYQAK